MTGNRVQDYCGYCGRDFDRGVGDTPEVCPTCLHGPERQQILEDLAEAQAYEAGGRELEQRARLGK